MECDTVTYHEGLVDCFDMDSFDKKVADLKEKWDIMEQNAFTDRKSYQPEFHGWFIRYKADDFRHCTLRSLREEIGLGSPPRPFFTSPLMLF